MKRTLIAIATLATSLTLSAQTTAKWTLQQCIDYAIAHNIQIQKNYASVRSAQIDLLEAKAARQVSMTGSAAEQVQYRPFQESAGNFVNGGMASSSSTKVTESGSYGINASWTLWDGQRTKYNIQNAQLSQDIAETASAISANSLQEQIAQLYIQILYTQEAYKVDEELLKQDQQLYDRGAEFVNQGQMSRADLAELEAQVSTAKYDLVNVQTQIDNYKFQLKQLLELSPMQDIDIADVSVTDAQVMAVIPDRTTIYNKAVASRPEIRQNELAIQQSQLATKIAKTNRMPTISLTGSLGDSHMSGSQNNFFNQMKQNLNAVVGVSLSIPILDNRKTKSAIERAQVNELTAQLDLQDTQKNIWQSVETYWINAVNNQAKYKAAKVSVSSAQTSYDMLNEKFTVGLKNISDLLQARSKLLTAKQTMLEDKYTALFNLALLKFYAGESINF